MAGVYFNDKYIGDIGGGTSSGGSRPKVTTAWLRRVSWQNNKQTVDVSGVTAGNTVIVCPDVGYYRPYYDNSVNPAGQAAESMSFECVDVPDQDIRVNFLLYDDTEELAEAAPYLLTQEEDGTLSVTLDGTAVTVYTLQKLSNGSWADATEDVLSDGDMVRAAVDGRVSNHVSYINYNRIAADKVIALINTAKSSGAESDVTAARSAYDALTDTQKGMVTNYSDLTALESRTVSVSQYGGDKNGNAYLRATISGFSNPTYQWQIQSGGNWSNISGATAAEFKTADVGSTYRVSVSLLNSDALTVAKIPLSVLPAKVGTGIVTGQNRLEVSGMPAGKDGGLKYVWEYDTGQGWLVDNNADDWYEKYSQKVLKSRVIITADNANFTGSVTLYVPSGDARVSVGGE